jgi:hypothetical protein
MCTLSYKPYLSVPLNFETCSTISFSCSVMFNVTYRLESGNWFPQKTNYLASSPYVYFIHFSTVISTGTSQTICYFIFLFLRVPPIGWGWLSNRGTKRSGDLSARCSLEFRDCCTLRFLKSVYCPAPTWGGPMNLCIASLLWFRPRFI